MAMTVRTEGSAVIILLDGRLALGGPVDDFRAAWMQAVNDGAKNLVINMTTVTMVDSTGIGSMIRCHSAMTQAGGKVKLVGTSPTVRQAFKITRLDQVFEFYDSEKSALA